MIKILMKMKMKGFYRKYNDYLVSKKSFYLLKYRMSHFINILISRLLF